MSDNSRRVIKARWSSRQYERFRTINVLPHEEQPSYIPLAPVVTDPLVLASRGYIKAIELEL